MKKKIRKAAMLLAHIGVLLSILFLIFFLISAVKANRTAAALSDPEASESVTEQEMHLEKAVHSHDFSVLSVGKALSDRDEPMRDNLLLIIDLIIPVLFLASGILLQAASVRAKRKKAQPQRSYSASFINRRQP